MSLSNYLKLKLMDSAEVRNNRPYGVDPSMVEAARELSAAELLFHKPGSASSQPNLQHYNL